MISGRTIQEEVAWANVVVPGDAVYEDTTNYPFELPSWRELEGKREGSFALNISPFVPEQVNPNSYNVTLGDTIGAYPENIANWMISNQQYKGISDKHAGYLREWWANLPERMRAQLMRAYPIPEVLDTKKEPELLTTKIWDDGITLFPGILYLGHTVERTKCHGLVPKIDGRSSVARLGIQVHMTAGFGDNGFDGQWTFEIMVAFPVRIYAGCQIAQISFDPINGKQGPFYEGKYQGQTGPRKSGWWKENEKL